MAVDTALGAPIRLAEGCSLRPPQGWAQYGWVIHNPLRLLPQNHLRWRPGNLPTTSLHWDLSRNALPARHMSYLIEVLEDPPGMLLLDRLKPLSYALIRMPLAWITRAEVMSYARTWPMLRISYHSVEDDRKGVVHYSPTDLYHRGEYQILAYEGTGADYDRYLDVALKSMASFALGTYSNDSASA